MQRECTRRSWGKTKFEELCGHRVADATDSGAQGSSEGMVEPTPMKVHYDEQFDVLEISVEDPEPAVTIELKDDVYVHVVPETKVVIGVTIHHFREHHTDFTFPFQGMLNPVSPQVAQDIEKALSPA